MKKIEDGLKKVHSMTGMETEETGSNASGSLIEEPTQYTDPFLRVNLVSSGSPAEQAVRPLKFNHNHPFFWLIGKWLKESSQ